MPKQRKPFIKLLARDLIALFGAHNLKDYYETGRTSLSPGKIQVHDDWNPNLETFDADIAILTFEAGAIMFSTYVQPICLWNDKTNPNHTEGHIGGWGQSETLENTFEEIPTKLKIPIHANEFCFLTTKDLVDLASNRTFCAGKGNGKGVCDGDSGGEVSIRVGSSLYFRGIVSSGLYDELGCDASKYSVFTDVLQFKPWIDEIISEGQIISDDDEILLPKFVRPNLRCTITGHMIFFKTCKIYDQKIDGEGVFVDVDPNQLILAFHIRNNKEVKFLPENIAESFPLLTEYHVTNCSIRTVTGKHFKVLNNLWILSLEDNEIESIDGDSFKDLTKLGSISLKSNKIKTIPGHLFTNNLKLEAIYLNQNQINKISFIIFDHLKNLKHVNLAGNACVNYSYYVFSNWNRFNYMRNVMSMHCRSPLDVSEYFLFQNTNI